jgi:hypothetical protein
MPPSVTQQVYTLIAKRDAARPDTLTVRYESREHALAAAAVLQEYCAVVQLTDGDGSEVEATRSAESAFVRESTDSVDSQRT